MADDARISTALPRHPKTVKLQRRLGAPGCWSLVCLFLWVADSRPEGDLEGMTAEDIEIAANWPGPSGDFVRTLAEVRFLDGKEGTYKIHDWAEHNPWAANRPKRREAARAAAGARWKNGKASAEADADRMQVVCDPHETAMPTSPHLTSPPDTTSEAPPPVKEPVFALQENARAREACEKPITCRELSEEMVKELADSIALPATRPHLEVLASALKVIKTKHCFASYSDCSQFLESCVENARSHQDLKLEFKPRFFFEDGDYEPYRPIPPELLAPSPPAALPECIVGRCRGCGRPRLTGSSWSEYCADSCRDAHERATA